MANSVISQNGKGIKSNVFIEGFQNVAQKKYLQLVSTNSEQVYFIVGNCNTAVASLITHSNGNDVSTNVSITNLTGNITAVSKSGNTLEFNMNQEYFRGQIISNNPFRAIFHT